LFDDSTEGLSNVQQSLLDNRKDTSGVALMVTDLATKVKRQQKKLDKLDM
jgi:hypothetical protein